MIVLVLFCLLCVVFVYGSVQWCDYYFFYVGCVEWVVVVVYVVGVVGEVVEVVYVEVVFQCEVVMDVGFGGEFVLGGVLFVYVVWYYDWYVLFGGVVIVDGEYFYCSGDVGVDWVVVVYVVQ